jgi:hypothetical protein
MKAIAGLILGAIVIIGIIIVPFMLTESGRNELSHMKSDLIGLNRSVTLYAMDGTVITNYSGRFKVEHTNGSYRFLNEDNKAITLSGTVLIEEQ